MESPFHTECSFDEEPLQSLKCSVFVDKIFNIVMTFNRKDALLSIIFQPQMQQEDKLFFFYPWKLESIFI